MRWFIALSLVVTPVYAQDCSHLPDELRQSLSSSLSDFDAARGIMVNVGEIDRFVSSEARDLFFSTRTAYFNELYAAVETIDLTVAKQQAVRIIRDSTHSAWEEIHAFYNDTAFRDQLVGIPTQLMQRDQNNGSVLLEIICQ